MSVVDTERVLVVPTELIHRLGYFQGFSRDIDRYLKGFGHGIKKLSNRCQRRRESVVDGKTWPLLV